jgi:phosphoesterase RecJ-like protein
MIPVTAPCRPEKKSMNNILTEKLTNAGSVIVLGHIHPDGDCVGSTLALYNYVKKEYPDKNIKVYLQKPSPKFGFLRGFEEIINEPDLSGTRADLAVALDSSDRERLGEFGEMFDLAADTLNIDHHITNTHYAKATVLEENSSSSCEVLYGLLDADRIDKETAECLYTGIINDTGVFKYSSTSPKTMRIAGKLMEKGICPGDIIDRAFYQKTYVQGQILGRALLESILLMDGKCIFTSISKKEMDFYEVDGKDLDGIIDQLRLTEGIECAIFIYEVGPQQWKVSLRSNNIVDVSKIAMYFAGGGHVHAAGCTMNGGPYDIINALSERIYEQLKENGKNV